MFREGFLASTSVPIRLYFRTRPGLETPDATVSILPFIYEMINRQRLVSKRFKGITMNVNVLRSESTGSVHVTSKDRPNPRRSASISSPPSTTAPGCLRRSARGAN